MMFTDVARDCCSRGLSTLGRISRGMLVVALGECSYEVELRDIDADDALLHHCTMIVG